MGTPLLTPSETSVLTQVVSAAIAAERATANPAEGIPGCPAELSTAQCLIESAWLACSPGNNCFGIKATDSHATYQITKEFLDGTWRTMTLAFESYPSLADCFIAHARLLQGGPYLPAWKQYCQDRDLDTLIRGISAHYATDPSYAEKVLTLAHGPHVTAMISAARAVAA